VPARRGQGFDPAFRRTLLVFALLCLASRSAVALVIRGDTLWVENPACPPQWESREFDDSAWKPAANRRA
jgi:hypothetical protein